MDWFEKFLIGALIVISVGVVVLLITGNKNKERLMAECMKDRKEYECVSILHSRGLSTIPIFIGR